MDRITAINIINQYVKSDVLLKHLIGVEAAMRVYAKKLGEDENKWGITGLLHDFDWEICPKPDDHPTYGAKILREKNVPDDIVKAVLSHGNHTGIIRETKMEKTLFAVDELSGFIRAVALVRPSKSLNDLKVSSVKKKMKDKAFAKEVNRDDIIIGAEELGVELDEHINFVINSLKPISKKIGLNL